MYKASASAFFNKQNIPKLDEIKRSYCEGDLSPAECLNVLKGLQSSKTPGTDGLNAEFYKFFWKDIGCCVTDSFNYAKLTGKMSIDQRRGIMSLIPKKKKD